MKNQNNNEKIDPDKINGLEQITPEESLELIADVIASQYKRWRVQQLCKETKKDFLVNKNKLYNQTKDKPSKKIKTSNTLR